MAETNTSQIIFITLASVQKSPYLRSVDINFGVIIFLMTSNFPIIHNVSLPLKRGGVKIDFQEDKNSQIRNKKAVNIPIQIRFTPLPFSNVMFRKKVTSSTVKIMTSSNNKSVIIDRNVHSSPPTTTPFDLSKETDLVESHSFVFLIEISDSIERRLLCGSLQNYLHECQLLDCANGALLLQDPRKRLEFDGYSCRVPSKVVVRYEDYLGEVPLCWCMQALAILSDVGFWDAKLSMSGAGVCALDLILLPQSKLIDVITTTCLASWCCLCFLAVPLQSLLPCKLCYCSTDFEGLSDSKIALTFQVFFYISVHILPSRATISFPHLVIFIMITPAS